MCAVGGWVAKKAAWSTPVWILAAVSKWAGSVIFIIDNTVLHLLFFWSGGVESLWCCGLGWTLLRNLNRDVPWISIVIGMIAIVYMASRAPGQSTPLTCECLRVYLQVECWWDGLSSSCSFLTVLNVIVKPWRILKFLCMFYYEELVGHKVWYYVGESRG